MQIVAFINQVLLTNLELAIGKRLFQLYQVLTSNKTC